jgi:hypothetical protein
VKGSAAALSALAEVLIRESVRTREIFAALYAGPPFGEVCQESISNQAGIGNKHTRR